jgi:ferritin-like metal-binding protein YciE
MTDPDEITNVFVAGLKNAHAMEKQALSIMQPQLNRLESYPEVADMLDRHIRETENQVDRLDELLSSLDDSASGLKDMMLSAGGTMAALGHTAAEDEILKNTFANFAFENFEIAAYSSLITIAQSSGMTTAVDSLQQSLDEERRMADWIEQNLAPITQKYLSLRASGEQAGV